MHTESVISNKRHLWPHKHRAIEDIYLPNSPHGLVTCGYVVCISVTNSFFIFTLHVSL